MVVSVTPARGRGAQSLCGRSAAPTGSCSSWQPRAGRSSPRARAPCGSARRLGPTVEAAALPREACMSAPPRDEGPQGLRVDQVGPETVEKLTGTRQAWREPPRPSKLAPRRGRRRGGRMCGRCARVPVCPCAPGRPHPPRVPLQFVPVRALSARVAVRVSPPVTPELGARAFLGPPLGPPAVCTCLSLAASAREFRHLGTSALCGMCSPG